MSMPPPCEGMKLPTHTDPCTDSHHYAIHQFPHSMYPRPLLASPFGRHYSHSMVAGGLLLMSYVTLLIPLTSLMMRVLMRASLS